MADLEMREKKDQELLLRKKARLLDVERRAEAPIDHSAVVDDMFGFLESQTTSSMSESQAPSAFRDLPAPKTVQNGDIIEGIPTSPDDFEDLSEYKFPKFAATYFQGFQRETRIALLLDMTLNFGHWAFVVGQFPP